MAIKKIEIRPEGINDYADVVYPKTSADQVIANDGKTLEAKFGELLSGIVKVGNAETLDGYDSTAFAFSGHTHNYAGSASAGGSATSALKLATSRTITLTGDVTGSVSFNGEANVSITAVIQDNSHNHTKSNITDFPVSLPANGGNSDTVDSTHIWIGQESLKGTSANTLYFCY